MINNRMSSQSTKSHPILKKLRKHWVVFVIIGMIVVSLGYILVQYMLDQNSYNQGHAAYQAANCSEAIEYYDALFERWRIVDLGGFLENAEAELGECIRFQEADNFINGGNYAAALKAHYQFKRDHSKSHLAVLSEERIKLLLGSIYPEQLASMDTCPDVENLINQQLIPYPEMVLPPFYYYCGIVYSELQDFNESYNFHRSLLIQFPDHELSYKSETELLGNSFSCQKIRSFAGLPSIADRPDFIPTLYFTCGQAYEKLDDYWNAFDMYAKLLDQYPEHPMAAEAKELILNQEEVCANINTLKNSSLEGNSEIKPTLYYKCGVYYQANQNYPEAIQLLDYFLDKFPAHELAFEVEASLADAIAASFKGSETGEIPRPGTSGTTDQDETIVIIKNETPQRLRIVFSGPESRIEELGPCSTCQNYPFEPLLCPDKGPVGRYSLTPGEYEVVVETSTDKSVTPFTGSWNLRSGTMYTSCFYILTTMFP